MADSAHLAGPEGTFHTLLVVLHTDTSAETQTPTTSGAKAKKANPLIDLIDTEKTYVDNLTGIIRVGVLWRLVCSHGVF